MTKVNLSFDMSVNAEEQLPSPDLRGYTSLRPFTNAYLSPFHSICVSSAFGGEKWKTNVLLTAFLCPGYDGAEAQRVPNASRCPPLPSLLSIVFADFFLMNLILWGEGSSAAMPFGTLVAILALWFCVSVPLTFVGAYFGFKKTVSLSRIDLLHGICLFTQLFGVVK